MITATITQYPNFQLVEIASSEPSYEPSAIEQAIAACQSLEIDTTKGVVISHRGAIWLHAALSHYFRIAAWVGHFTPNLGAAVVVATHSKGVKIGDVIEIPKP